MLGVRPAMAATCWTKWRTAAVSSCRAVICSLRRSTAQGSDSLAAARGAESSETANAAAAEPREASAHGPGQAA
eukprot:6241168-Alexandrium_andersonii.AAC.1